MIRPWGSGRVARVPDGDDVLAARMLRGECHGVVGRSAAMQSVFDSIEHLATGSAPVLIVGETGTGKELIARAIHERSARRHGPYVAINCAALPRDLIESELFGHCRGAFSGALVDHPGLIRAAAGGTVLLDEITEMSHELQAKLLRVLQERTVRPVGAVSEEAVDVRFLASSNRDIDEALQARTLRMDLYYRLSVGVITVPPLRQRGDDVTLLSEHYLGILQQRYGGALRERRGITRAALDALARHAWPGNVRELFNVIERAFIASHSPLIERTDLALPPLLRAPAAAPLRVGGSASYAESERALIERTLDATGGNKARAARQLGISRKRLYARLAKYAL